LVLPTSGEHVLPTAEQTAKEFELGSRGPFAGPGTDAGASDALQLAQTSCGNLTQAIEFSDSLLSSFDLRVEVDGDANILNARPV
jgi:hypothetical protein